RIDVFDRHADGGGNIDGHVTFLLNDCQDTAFSNRGSMSRPQFAAGETMARERLRGTFCAESREADREAPSVSEDSELAGRRDRIEMTGEGEGGCAFGISCDDICLGDAFAIYVVDALDLPVFELRLHEIRKRDVRDRASRINRNH